MARKYVSKKQKLEKAKERLAEAEKRLNNLKNDAAFMKSIENGKEKMKLVDEMEKGASEKYRDVHHGAFVRLGFCMTLEDVTSYPRKFNPEFIRALEVEAGISSEESNKLRKRRYGSHFKYNPYHPETAIEQVTDKYSDRMVRADAAVKHAVDEMNKTKKTANEIRKDCDGWGSPAWELRDAEREFKEALAKVEGLELEIKEAEIAKGIKKSKAANDPDKAKREKEEQRRLAKAKKVLVAIMKGEQEFKWPPEKGEDAQ